MVGSIGEIRIFCGRHIPRGWLLCDGRWLSKSLYKGLDTCLDGRYGSNATQFRLPDLQGRIPVNYTGGIGMVLPGVSGTSSIPLANASPEFGNAATTITANHMPFIDGTANLSGALAYVETSVSETIDIAIPCNNAPSGLTETPVGNYVTRSDIRDASFEEVRLYSKQSNHARMAPFTKSVSLTGQIEATAEMQAMQSIHSNLLVVNTAHEPVKMMQSSLALNYIICYQGAYSSRSRRRALQQVESQFAGTVTLPASKTRQATVTVSHNLDIQGIQTIHLSVKNAGSYTDAFAANVISSCTDQNSFKAVITRIDGDSWGQTPYLSWTIFSKTA